MARSDGPRRRRVSAGNDPVLTASAQHPSSRPQLKTMVGFPLLLIPLAVFNIVAFLMPDVSPTVTLFSLHLMSGTEWPVTLSDVLIALGMLLLLLEIIKGARPGAKFLMDHLLSLVVFGAAAAEFVLWPKFGNSTFFLLTLLSLWISSAGLRFGCAAPCNMHWSRWPRRARRSARRPSLRKRRSASGSRSGTGSRASSPPRTCPCPLPPSRRVNLGQVNLGRRRRRSPNRCCRIIRRRSRPNLRLLLGQPNLRRRSPHPACSRRAAPRPRPTSPSARSFTVILRRPRSGRLEG